MAAGQLTLYGAQALLGTVFGQTVTPPSTWYFALCTALPNPQMNGSEIQEPPSASNYSRLAIPALNITPNQYWEASANAPYVMTAQSFYWPQGANIGATSDWPQCPGWALCDALTGGNAWAIGTLAVPVSTPAGFCAYLGAGTLSIELSPYYNIQSN